VSFADRTGCVSTEATTGPAGIGAGGGGGVGAGVEDEALFFTSPGP
jgi:hypothetical protein